MSERFLAELLPGGWLLWHTGKPGGVAEVMPAPDPAWPERLQDAYMARVEANLTGSYPRCSTADMTVTPVAPRRADGALAHEPGCPVGELAGANEPVMTPTDDDAEIGL